MTGQERVAAVNERLVESGAFTREVLESFEQRLVTCIQDDPRAFRPLLQLSDPEAFADLLGSCLDDTARGDLLVLAETAIQVGDELRADAKEAWSGTISLPWESERAPSVTGWRIDERHASACGYNRRTASVVTDEAPCGSGGAIDQAWNKVVEATLDEALVVLSEAGWPTEHVGLIEDLVRGCLDADTQDAVVRCVRFQVLERQSELPPDSLATLQAAAETFFGGLQEREATLRDELNGRGEVTLAPEHLGSARLSGDVASLDVTLPTAGVLLLVVE